MLFKMRVLGRNRENTRRAWLAACVLALPLAWLAAADPARVEKTLETIPNPRISLINLTGQVVVKGWDKPQVHFLSTTASPRVEIDEEALPAGGGPAEKIHLNTHVLDSLAAARDQAADYWMDVPIGSTLEIRNRQGSVQVENIQGETSVESVGATVLVKDVAGHLAVHSVGGDVKLIRSSGHVEASSITGNLQFVSPTGLELRANTSSGTITYQGDFVPGGEYVLSNYSGNIEIFCPASSSFELEAKTVRGKLENSLPITRKRHAPSPLAPGYSLLGTHNTGNATVQLTSYSGTIRIRPQF